MRKVIMAIAIRKIRHACERCHHPVHPGSDFLRAQLWGRCTDWHWPCFIRQLREHDQRTAETISEAAR